MGQCCLGGEKSEEHANLHVNEKQKGPTDAAPAVNPKTSVPNEGDGKPVKASAKPSTAVHGDDLKLSVKSEAIAPKSAVTVVNSKLEHPNAALKKKPTKPDSPYEKMERGPKVKIVVDENRILQNIKEKQSIKDEVAMIGRGKSAQFKSSIRSVPPSSAKSKAPTVFKSVISDIEDKPVSSTNEDMSSLSNPSGAIISSNLSSPGGASKSSNDKWNTIAVTWKQQ